MYFKEENLESNMPNNQDPHFGILTVDTFDDQQQPIIPPHYQYSLKLSMKREELRVTALN